MEEVTCPKCSAPMEQRKGKFGPFFGCSRFPECDVIRDCRYDFSPSPEWSDGITRAARVRAHATFDVLWKSGAMSRDDAYAWLASRLGVERIHMKKLTLAECARVVEVCGAAVDLRP